MRKGSLQLIAGVAILLALSLAGCIQSPNSSSSDALTQPTRFAAATAQAELNLLQNEAAELETVLDEKFSEHFSGMLVESYPSLRVIVFLTDAGKEDLAAFVENPTLFGAIEVKQEGISRQALRAMREWLRAEMDKAGVKYTTEIKMEPARLRVFVFNISDAKAKLDAAGVDIPAQVEFVQADELPEGG